MRITFVLPAVNMSGGIKVLGIYATALAARGHAVVLVSPPPWRMPISGKFKSLLSGNGWPKDVLAYASHLDQSGLDHRILDRSRPVNDRDVPDADVVIATWWETAEWVRKLSPAKGAKAYFVQDYGAHAGQPLERVAKTWRPGLHMFTISEWMRELVVKNSDVKDIAVVPNSVDFRQFCAPVRDKQSRPTVGLLHDLRPQKGTPSILAALKLVLKSVPDLKVVAFGPQAPVEPLPEGSEFFHRARDEDLPKIYAKCDVWVFASVLEGFGLPILEAMACRTPVVATPAGAAPMLLAAGGGRLVRHDDIPGMALAIQEVLSLSREEWRELSRVAFDSISGYTWEDACDKFEIQLQAAITVAQSS